MMFELIINPEGLDMYGEIPCLPVYDWELDGKGERFVGDEPDSWLLLDDFVEKIYPICENDLSYGDVDYFNKEKCIILKKWLADRMKKPMTPRLELLYGVLRDYVDRAIELGTGVVIEL